METSDPNVVRALLHPLRADLIYELAFAGGKARVSDLAASVQKPANSVSYHLAQLAKVGVVEKFVPTNTSDSRESWYRLTDEEIRVRLAEDANRDAALRSVITQLVARESSAVSRRRERAFRDPNVAPNRLITQSGVLELTAQQEAEFYGALAAALAQASAAEGENRKAKRADTQRIYLSLECFPLLDADSKKRGEPTR